MTRIYVETIAYGNYALAQIGKRFGRFSKDQTGATAVEYSLIVALVAIAITAAATTLGTNVSNLFERAACSVRSGVWTAATNTCAP
jgi:pilus assembly protein Flp/PilA